MPGSSSASCFFANDFALPDFFEGVGALLSNCSGLRGCDWLRESIIVSQMIAEDGGPLDEVLVEGYVAATQTKTCLVFQLKREVRSVKFSIMDIYLWVAGIGKHLLASRSNFI